MPKILVIDDDLNVCKLMRANLATREYQVSISADGETGLKQAALNPPDLILLDLKMPGMSGWDVLMALKNSSKLRKIPVIIMTAWITAGEDYGIRGGNAAFLNKPFSVDDVKEAIRRLLANS